MTAKDEKLELTEVRPVNLALVIVKATNPCILSLVMLLAILITGSGSLLTIAVWSLIIFSFLIAIPLIYVYLRTSLDKSVRFPKDPTTYLKQHPKNILVLGVLCGLSSLTVLYFLRAPAPLLETLAALLISALVVAIINLFYRASFHITATTILIIMAAVIWRPVFMSLAVIIPFIGWAKYNLREHTFIQMIVTIPLAAIVVTCVHYLPV
jgi:hypothetical protein